MTKTPLLLLPGLLCDENLWSHQIASLADIADISVADLTRDDSIEAMAATALSEAPVVIEDCGHLSPLERPYAVSAALRCWLQV
ncbi:MAG: hypothetical protein HQ513_01355 [Rhodospirillales bacterium]|nr:hypothetical protein [Rhodospirillales bacterium]